MNRREIRIRDWNLGTGKPLLEPWFGSMYFHQGSRTYRRRRLTGFLRSNPARDPSTYVLPREARILRSMNLGNVGHAGSRLLQGGCSRIDLIRRTASGCASVCHSFSINLLLGFELIHRHHQKDFRERETLGRDVRDSKHS